MTSNQAELQDIPGEADDPSALRDAIRAALALAEREQRHVVASLLLEALLRADRHS